MMPSPAVLIAAAALASENKVLSHPASVDSIPTSGNKEDYVSMGMTAALKLRSILSNTANILAIELLTASRAIDLLAPLGTGTLAAYGDEGDVFRFYDINPAVATKVSDRGTGQAVGVVTDVGLFLDHLSRKLVSA